MGEGTDALGTELRPGDAPDAVALPLKEVTWHPAARAVGEAPTVAGGEDEITAARAGIEQTRAHMSETIDAIQEKLSPTHMGQEATSAVREATIGRAQTAASSAGETAKDVGTGLANMVRQNPIPAAAGAALGWLYVTLRRRSSAPHRPTMPERAWAGHPQANAPTGSTAGATNRVRQTASNVAEQVRGTVAVAAAQVQETASQVTEQAQAQISGFGNQAQQRARRAQYSVRETLRERPLAIAAAAIAIGIGIGLAVPETPKEHELLGPAKDTVIDQARHTVQDAVQQAQTIAQDALSAAKGAAAGQKEATSKQTSDTAAQSTYETEAKA